MVYGDKTIYDLVGKIGNGGGGENDVDLTKKTN
jgi:hypothetical protein